MVEVVGMDEVGHSQDTDKVEVADRDPDVWAEAAGSYRPEGQDDSDMPGEADPSKRSEAASHSYRNHACELTGY